MTIRNWPKDEQPRQKLLQHGARVLSDAELLAILLRVGTKKHSVVKLARILLCKFNGLRGLLCLNKQEFCAQHGLGIVSFIQLHASLELAARYIEAPWQRQSLLRNPKDVKEYLLLRYAPYRHQEVFTCLFLNNKQELLGFEPLFFGTYNRSTIYPRECARRALYYNAAAVIIAHNHPSGITKPSSADEQTTALIQKALHTIEVKLYDHYVVGFDQCVSFVESGQNHTLL